MSTRKKHTPRKLPSQNKDDDSPKITHPTKRGAMGTPSAHPVTVLITENKSVKKRQKNAKNIKEKMMKKRYKCLKCKQSFYEVFDLNAHMLAHKNDKKYACKICGKNFIQERTFQKHMKSHPHSSERVKSHSFKAYECKKCKLNFRSKMERKKHLKSHSMQCTLCFRMFKSRIYFKRHTLLHMPVSERLIKSGKAVQESKCFSQTDQNFQKQSEITRNFVKSVDSADKKDQKNWTFWCKICPNGFETSLGLKRHAIIHRRKQFNCMYCSKESRSMVAYIMHRNVHKLRKCGVCDRKFLCVGSFKLHRYFCKTKCGNGIQAIVSKNVLPDDNSLNKNPTLKCVENVKVLRQAAPKRKSRRSTVSEEDRNVCKICKKKFSSSSCLSRHKRVHTGEKPYKCEECPRAFCEKGVLDAHMVTHTGIPLAKKFQCTACGKGFTRSSILQNHLRIHGDQKLKCEHCGKSFPHKKILERHLTTHINEKKFQCQFCDRKFLTKSNLKRHAQIHSGEKPFKCDKCTKAFTQEINLKTHLRTHSGEKPFKCEICSKTFSQNGNLKNHMNTHNETKRFSCKICRRSFSQFKILKQHEAKMHKLDESEPNKLISKQIESFQNVLMNEQAPEIDIIMNVTAITSQDTSNVRYRCELCNNNEEFMDSNSLMNHMQSHNMSSSTQPSNDIIMEAVCTAQIIQPEERIEHFNAQKQMTLNPMNNAQGGASEFLSSGQNIPPIDESNLHLVAELAYQQPGYVLPSMHLPAQNNSQGMNPMQGGVAITNTTYIQQLAPPQMDRNAITNPGGSNYPHSTVLMPTVQNIPNPMAPATQFGHTNQQTQTEGHPPPNFPSNISYIIQAPTIVQTYAFTGHSAPMQPQFHPPQPQRCQKCSNIFNNQYELFEHLKMCNIQPQYSGNLQ